MFVSLEKHLAEYGSQYAPRRLAVYTSLGQASQLQTKSSHFKSRMSHAAVRQEGFFTVPRSAMFTRVQNSIDGQFYVKFGRRKRQKHGQLEAFAFSPPLEGTEAR